MIDWIKSKNHKRRFCEYCAVVRIVQLLGWNK